MTDKELIVKAMTELPEDASYQDAMDRLYFLYKIEQGLADSRAGRKVTQEEAKRKLAR